MYSVLVNNEYNGYSEVNDEILVNPKIECEHEELIEVFKDLCTKCGTYHYTYDYDGRKIKITYGYHCPNGMRPIKIDRQWLDYDISQMSNWSKRKIVENCL